ncbi:MAG: hypothetical protein IJ339_06545 [Oscillospiraceae bacterium]|nr:hypothetical protein [Oscillospiraceae bacterium]
MSNYYNMTQSSINSISGNIRYELEQSANLITDSGYEITSVDIENQTATLSCFILPKEFNPEKTTVNIVCNDTEYPMTCNNGKYTADITLPMFHNSHVTAVHLIDNGTVRTQQLNWRVFPKDDMMPQITAHAGGSVSSMRGNGVATRKYSQTVSADIYYPTANFKLESAQIVARIDNKEIYRKEVEWTDAHSSRGEPATPYDAPLDENWIMCSTEFEESFEVPYNSNICIYIEFKDNMGLVYRNMMDDVTIADNGEPINNNIYGGYQSDIYTADGKPLYLKINDEEYN